MPLERFYLVALLLLLVAADRGLTATVGADDGRQFAYNGFAGRGLDLDGAAEVTPNGLLMLTNGTIQQKGHAFHPSPVPLRAARSFSTAFVFAIFGQYIDLSSPGMAFFVTTSKEVLATALPGQFLGLLNATNNTNPNAHIFAVELDTLLNSECRDMNSNHVGVDLDSMVSRASADAGYYDDATGRASATVVLAVGIAAYIIVRRRLRYAEVREDWEVAFGPQPFSYKDLYQATKGFSETNLLGAGGFGSVYKGVLRKPDMDTEVAVKRVSHQSRQGMKEFVAEVASMRRLHHRNLVQLLGYCRRKGELLLVYDHMPNGSLDKYLHDPRPGKATLEWPQRLHIIRGVASGLSYLHEGWEQIVIHRDVKASNVLLDGEMNGRLGDFGLARLYDHGSDARTTHVVGTMGYLAPELGHTGKATPSTDVFAFGAFLLEVTCGRRPIEEDEGNNRVMLVDWVAEHWRQGCITNAADIRMPNNFSLDEVSLVLKLGLLCSHPLSNARPTMRQVMQYLDDDMPLPEFSSEYLGSTMLELMYSAEFFNKNVTSYVGVISDLSGGR
uniref:non-specific serine/threonine protein kinase n=1 Tax=Aegilops tauschii TaxID=37682 RepID=R7W375_AEGTA